MLFFPPSLTSSSPLLLSILCFISFVLAVS
jgi:hypothetical protein